MRGRATTIVTTAIRKTTITVMGTAKIVTTIATIRGTVKTVTVIKIHTVSLRKTSIRISRTSIRISTRIRKALRTSSLMNTDPNRMKGRPMILPNRLKRNLRLSLLHMITKCQRKPSTKSTKKTKLTLSNTIPGSL